MTNKSNTWTGGKWWNLAKFFREKDYILFNRKEKNYIISNQNRDKLPPKKSFPREEINKHSYIINKHSAIKVYRQR